MNNDKLKIDIDTSEAVTSLDALRERITANNEAAEQCRKTIDSLTKETPWYRRGTILQWANCAISLVIVALQLLNLYLVLTR